MYQRILIPTDGTACSDECIVHAIAIAKAMRATLVFLFVMNTIRTYREGVVNGAEALEILTTKGKAALGRAEHAATVAGVHSESELVEGDPEDVIVQRSSDFDLVVMASHGKGLWRRLTVGSVTEGVLHKIARPLLVVRCKLQGAAPSG